VGFVCSPVVVLLLAGLEVGWKDGAGGSQSIWCLSHPGPGGRDRGTGVWLLASRAEVGAGQGGVAGIPSGMKRWAGGEDFVDPRMCRVLGGPERVALGRRSRACDFVVVGRAGLVRCS